MTEEKTKTTNTKWGLTRSRKGLTRSRRFGMKKEKGQERIKKEKNKRK